MACYGDNFTFLLFYYVFLQNFSHSSKYVLNHELQKHDNAASFFFEATGPIYKRYQPDIFLFLLLFYNSWCFEHFLVVDFLSAERTLSSYYNCGIYSRE